MSTLSHATIPKYVLNFFLWGPSALPVAESTWTTGLSAPAGLVDKDRRREAFRVRFTPDGEADASGGGGGGEAGEEAMIRYLIGNLFLLKIKVVKRLHKLEIWKI